ncbi:alpha-amylase family protein [Paenibacillus ginsengihumi]|uniref:alpha-amylase family protein n=1 Tax=Paenibacillus ginsengihumi TaxID=431596 RepID=UPI000367EDE8|nr:alpha-amylase family protein [Paenibacillus ginsengihumi]
MNWWSANKLRLIQTNLREIDADLDVDRLIAELKQYEANVLMINAGGIFAFYPSRLEYHYVTPYLKKDMLREAIDKAHEHGIRVIARFDFSKAHESVFERKPEWFYRTREGKEVNYYGIVHTCLNGAYQQHYSLDIIEEVLTNYPVDGIFFNMFGYQHWDYSGNRYGPCYCANCKRRFNEMFGRDLSLYEGPGHELHEIYREFQETTVRDILRRIRLKVKSLRSEIAICTYFADEIDIIRKESNTALRRSDPLRLYSASENVASVENSWDDKLVSNCCINAIDLTYRFTGVSKHEAEIRLYQNIANGSGLDFCIIGVFDGYPDGANLESVKAVYRHHARNEAFYGDLRSLADVALIKPKEPSARKEYEGLFRMLKEAHILFDVVLEERLTDRLEPLKQVKAVVVPGIPRLDEEQVNALSELQRQGVHLLTTGCALLNDQKALKSLFGAAYEGEIVDEPAAYIQVSEDPMLASFGDRVWIIAERFACMSYEPEAELHMPIVAPSTFGPPERAYGHALSEHYGLGIAGRGGCGAYYAWCPGEMYALHGFEDHKQAVIDPLIRLLQGRLRLRTDAPSATEWFLHVLPSGGYLLQAINLTGVSGATFGKPIPLHGLRVELAGIGRLKRAYSLCTGKPAAWQESEGGAALTVDLPEVYEAIVLEP